jgi:hypothetical protein
MIDVSPGDEIVYRKTTRALSGTRTGVVARVTGQFVWVLSASKRSLQISRNQIVSVRREGGRRE